MTDSVLLHPLPAPDSSANDAACAEPQRRRWAVAIFAARESPETLFAAVAATIAAAAVREDTVIDVLVNGNPMLAAAAAEHARGTATDSGAAPQVRVWSIALGDKSHTWNQYLHRIWPGSELAFFIDGYVRLRPDALELLSQGVLTSPTALGGSGVPSVGRAARSSQHSMTTGGGIHGNYCCIARPALVELRQRKFRFPLGLYRADAALGALFAYRLDPAAHNWDLKNSIFVEPAATWDTDPKRWWRLSDIRATFKRRERQAQGELENLALRDHFTLRRQPPQGLPATAAQLVLDWAESNPDAAANATRGHRRIARALARFREPRDWSGVDAEPQLLFGERS